VTIPEIAATAVTEPPGTALADQVPAEQAYHEKIAVTEAGADETMKSVTGATTGMQAATAPEEMIAGTTATALGSTVEGPAEVTAATAEVTVAMCAALATIVIAALVERPDRVEGQAATGAEIGSVRSVAATILPVETNVSSAAHPSQPPKCLTRRWRPAEVYISIYQTELRRYLRKAAYCRV